MEHKSLRTYDCVDKIINEYSGTVYKLAFAQTRNKSDAEDVCKNIWSSPFRK